MLVVDDPYRKLKMKVVIIDGNLSAGKSSLLSNVMDKSIFHSNIPYTIIPVYECVDKFTSFGCFNPLAMSYSSPKENAAIAQLHIVQSIHDHIESIVSRIPKDQMENCLLICDRSIYSPLVFSNAQHKIGSYNTFVHKYICSKARISAMNMIRKMDMEFIGLFYLDVSVNECMRRLISRGRVCETSHVNENFLLQIEMCYKEHLKKWIKLCGKENIVIAPQESSEMILEKFINFLIHITGDVPSRG